MSDGKAQWYRDLADEMEGTSLDVIYGLSMDFRSRAAALDAAEPTITVVEHSAEITLSVPSAIEWLERQVEVQRFFGDTTGAAATQADLDKLRGDTPLDEPD